MLTKHVGKGKIPGFTFYVYELRVTQYSCNIDQAYSVGGWILAKFLIISLLLWTETGEVNENAKKRTRLICSHLRRTRHGLVILRVIMI